MPAGRLRCAAVGAAYLPLSLSFDASVEEPTPELDDDDELGDDMLPLVPDVPVAPEVPDVPEVLLDVSLDDGVVDGELDEDDEDDGDDVDGEVVDGELIEPVELDEDDGGVVLGVVVVVDELELAGGVLGEVVLVLDSRLHAVRPIAAAMASTANGLTFIRDLRSGEGETIRCDP